MICADWSAETSNGSGRGGLTQEQFADLSGFSQQYISSLERGRRNPTIITIYELAVALGVSHMDLVRSRKGVGRGLPYDPPPPACQCIEMSVELAGSLGSDSSRWPADYRY